MNSEKDRLVLVSIMMMLCYASSTAHGQVHSATSAHTSYTGLAMTGYQGWFGAPGDGGTNNWRHYRNSDGFKPGAASIEYWPDMREADEDEHYETAFTFDDGTIATVFSSVHPKTVNRHFQWMKEYGINGAFMQRFRSDFGIRPTMNKILGNALSAAREHGRAIGLMYDLSGTNVKVGGVPNAALRAVEVKKIIDDWRALIFDLEITTSGNDQPYLYHNGKPLIVLWGLGFKSRHDGETGLDVQYWIDLVDSLQNNPDYGGCSVMLGIPTYWRTGSGDCIEGDEHDKMIELIKTVDIIQPWHTSRYRRDQMATTFKGMVTEDLAWCNANGIGYAPTISPGIREKILHDNDYEQPREGGYYFWDMAKAALEAGVERLYLGMFDEVDEGTQYHKINNNPPFYSSEVGFATYGTDPEDHYLWLAGEATRALRGEFTMGPTFRKRANDSDFQTEITFTDRGRSYEMQLVAEAMGRKVYYADPYKVPDGAPTVGTIRDTSLFKHELTSEVVTFQIEQRGLYIRLVEVDTATDTAISYSAVKPTEILVPADGYGITTWWLGEGMIETDPSQVSFPEDYLVTVSAVPAESWEFLEWTGDIAPSTLTDSDTVRMNSDKEIGALFYAHQSTVNYLYATHDSYVRGGLIYSGANFNGDSVLIVQEGGSLTDQMRSYIQFDLSSLEGNVEAAWVKLNITAEGLVGDMGVPVAMYQLSHDAWDESTLTWSNTPAEGPLLDRRDAIRTQEAVYAWDVTSFVRDEVNGDRIASLLIKDPTGSGLSVKFGNREGSIPPVMTVITEETYDVQNTGGILPETYQLWQNHPNPFNPSTMIGFSVPEISEVRLSIYNILGQEIAELVNQELVAGTYEVIWNPQHVSSGVYFYVLTASDFRSTKKMLLIK